MQPDKFKTDITSFLESLKGLPVILRSPALLKLWLVKMNGRRLVLLAALVILFLSASPISRSLVNYWHPAVEESFFTRLFNADKIRKSRETREAKYIQYMSIIISLGLFSTLMVLLSDMPRPVRAQNNRTKNPTHSSLESGADDESESAHTQNMNRHRPDHDSPDDILTATRTNTAHDPDILTPTPDLIQSAGTEITNKPASVTVTTPEHDFIGPANRYRCLNATPNKPDDIHHDAVDTLTHRNVRLMVFPAISREDKRRIEKIKNEAHELALLNHPNLMSVFDLFEHQDRLILVMEKSLDMTLADRIENDGALSVETSIAIIRALASALEFAGKLGFAHGDIKPASIMLDSNGDCRLTGLGITGADTPRLTGKAPDTQSDLVSLGITLYQMLTGQARWSVDTCSNITQDEIRQVILQRDIPAPCADELGALIFKMLDSNTSHRFQCWTALIDALEQSDAAWQTHCLRPHAVT